MDDVCIAADADYCNCACIVIAGAARKSHKKLPSYDTFSIKITAFNTRGYLLPS